MRDRFYMAAYAALLILAAAGLQHMWQRHMDMILLETEDGIDSAVTQVDGLIEQSQSHVAMLRISAEAALRALDSGRQAVPSYDGLLERNEAGDGYCTAADLTAGTPSVTGLGLAPSAGSAAGHEIAMTLMLAPQFAATARNIPNMAWAYYTSAQRFVTLYPFAACKDFAFSDDLYHHEFFTLGQPANNPAGKTFWTAAYVDEAGKGLMATVGAPVRDAEGAFRGTIAIDLTLATLSQYLTPRELAGGALTIVNEQEQVLGHPSLLAAGLAAAPQLKDVTPDYDAALRDLVFTSDGGFASHGAHLVASHALTGAPWRVVYVADRAALTLRAWRQSGVEVAGMLLLAGLIVAFEIARRRSRQLKLNLADLALANQRAEKARHEADSANHAKSLMMANVSHDLRTPLNAIIGFSDVMARQLLGALGSERYIGYAHDIKASGELLLKIINNLLDLSKAESGQYKLQEEVAEVPALIENCRHLVEAQAKNAGIELETSIARDLPAVRMDQRAIQRVILNLLSNAIKFTRPGGRVTLGARTDQQDQLTVTVADNGAGIAPADLAQLFKPFSRGASAHKANSEGTGLGLSIVKSLVELHGGTVHMTSTVGFGTTVTFRLPAMRNWRPDQPLPEVPPMELPKLRPAQPEKARAAA